MTADLRTVDAALKRFELGERLIRRNPLYYPAVQRQFSALQEMNLAERSQWTRDRLSNVLAAARRTAYGRRIGAPGSIEDWPILHKETVRGEPEAFHAAGNWLSTRASTGGTTGMPLELIRSAQSVVAEQVCIDRMLGALRADPGRARIAVLRGDNIKDPSDPSPPFWVHVLGGRRMLLSSNHLCAQSLPHYIEALETFRPDVLWAYPTTLESLCRLLALAGRRLHIPAVLTSSEMLYTQVWKLSQSLLGCQVVDYYGQAERVAFAYAAVTEAYFILPGYAHVEFIRRGDDGAESLYEVVGTSLWNSAMPLVRYSTGDLIRVPRHYRARELLEIAHGTRPFLGLIGRAHDVLLAPDGVSVLAGINQIPRSVDHLLRLQVVQQAADHVILRALVAHGFRDTDAEQLRANARQKIPAATRIEIQLVEELKRTAHGKTPFIIHAPEVKRALQAAGVQMDAR
jgi:phenylacetate-coenzyme A ligase PaaK-like adenylate-forming protein